jgi:hypothetical protein
MEQLPRLFAPEGCSSLAGLGDGARRDGYRRGSESATYIQFVESAL